MIRLSLLNTCQTQVFSDWADLQHALGVNWEWVLGVPVRVVSLPVACVAELAHDLCQLAVRAGRVDDGWQAAMSKFLGSLLQAFCPGLVDYHAFLCCGLRLTCLSHLQSFLTFLSFPEAPWQGT